MEFFVGVSLGINPLIDDIFRLLFENVFVDKPNIEGCHNVINFLEDYVNGKRTDIANLRVILNKDIEIEGDSPFNVFRDGKMLFIEINKNIVGTLNELFSQNYVYCECKDIKITNLNDKTIVIYILSDKHRFLTSIDVLHVFYEWIIKLKSEGRIPNYEFGVFEK